MRFSGEGRWVVYELYTKPEADIAHLRLECHNSKSVIFQEKLLKVLKCCKFLWLQRHNCSPAGSFANCVMTLYLLTVHLQTFLSIPVTQKWQILSCDTLVANERCCFLDFSLRSKTRCKECTYVTTRLRVTRTHSSIKVSLEFIPRDLKGN
jgi:hypothetical protein